MTAASQPANQVGGVYHHRLGDFAITALNDGYLPFSFDYVTQIDPAEASQLSAAAFSADPPRVTVGAFAVHTPSGVVLIDTGAGGKMADTLGKLPANLAAAGISPSDVSTILLTHMHGDHIGGMVDADGNACFPNAEVVVHAHEAAFWLAPDALAKAPDALKQSIAMAQAAMAPYGGRIRTLSNGEALAGFRIVPEPGHTPGHSGWMIESAGQALLVWGDIVHLPALQFSLPRIGLTFDIDSEAAHQTRLQVLEMAASERLLVAGMHLDFPPFGHVYQRDGAYAFAPITWSPFL